MLSKVLLWSTEIVSAFNEEGEEISLFKGKLSDILDPLLKMTDKNTKFLLGYFGIGQKEVSQWQWEAQARYFIDRNR